MSFTRKNSKNPKQVRNEKEKSVSISGKILLELIQAVHEKGASFRFKATGNSMTPSIQNQDIITVSPLAGAPPFPGEVVAFHHPENNKLVLHRVVKIKKNSFFIKADRQNVLDAEILLENIMGVVTRVERGEKVKFWPDRFIHPVRTRLYSKIYLRITRIRRLFRLLLRPIKKSIK